MTEEIVEYDEQGNLIHYRSSNGLEMWFEHNEQGNLIHYRTSEGVDERVLTSSHFLTIFSSIVTGDKRDRRNHNV